LEFKAVVSSSFANSSVIAEKHEIAVNCNKIIGVSFCPEKYEQSAPSIVFLNGVRSDGLRVGGPEARLKNGPLIMSSYSANRDKTI